MSAAFTDEELSAYLDGEADAALQARIDTALESDAALENRMAQLARLDELLKAAAPLPGTTSAELEAAARKLAAAHDGGANVVPLRRPSAVRTGGFVPTAIAATVALVVGFGGGMLLRADERVDPAIAAASGTLHAALQGTPSGEALTRDGVAVTPILTFRDGDGRACREFESRSAEAAAVGVACVEDGQWRIAALLAAASAPVEADGYRPASGFNDAALTAVLDKMMSGEALDAASEKNWMARGWE